MNPSPERDLPDTLRPCPSLLCPALKPTQALLPLIQAERDWLKESETALTEWEAHTESWEGFCVQCPQSVKTPTAGLGEKAGRWGNCRPSILCSVLIKDLVLSEEFQDFVRRLFVWKRGMSLSGVWVLSLLHRTLKNKLLLLLLKFPWWHCPRCNPSQLRVCMDYEWMSLKQRCHHWRLDCRYVVLYIICVSRFCFVRLIIKGTVAIIAKGLGQMAISVASVSHKRSCRYCDPYSFAFKILISFYPVYCEWESAFKHMCQRLGRGTTFLSSHLRSKTNWEDVLLTYQKYKL